MKKNICGLDLHKDTIFACIHAQDGTKYHEQYLTHSKGIGEMISWLLSHEVQSIAMESTASYWIGVWGQLEHHFDLTLVNPYFIKQMPGRKTDMKDAEWIAQLHHDGYLKGSLVPMGMIRELREYTRLRVRSVNHQTKIIQQVDRIYMDGNIRLSSICSLKSVSGMKVLRAVIEGQLDSMETLTHLIHGATKKRHGIEKVEACMSGSISGHMRLLLKMALDEYDHFQRQIDQFDQLIDDQIQSHFSEEVELLQTIPGVDKLAAVTILAEIGGSVEAFESPKRLVKWAGLCARNDQSAEKVKSRKITKGNRFLRRTLSQCAYGASRTKGTFYAEKFRDLSRRMHRNKAAVAIGRKLLCAVWYILVNKEPYNSPKRRPDTRQTQRSLAYHKKRMAEHAKRVAELEELTPV